MRTPTERPPCRWSRVGGQSTVEFIVLALVLIPLLLTVPLIGKYMDLAQTTTSASRYVAFEGMVHHGSSLHPWKSDAALAVEVRRRFFSNNDAPIKRDDVAGDFNAHRNPLWFDHRGDALLPSFASNVSASSQRESLELPFGAAYASGMGLSRTNLHTGIARVTVADVEGLAPFDTLGLAMQRSTTVLVDPWSASGPNAVRSAVRNDGWNPLGHFPYRPLEALVTPIEPFVAVLEGASAPEIGRVDPDFVPPDRIR